MHHDHLHHWQHDHTFGQDQPQPGERRTRIVIGITAVMMAVEIAAGIAYGSMALLADGIHMGSHAAALFVNVFAYVYARKHARDERFSFGTGKVNALGGYSGAILLGGFALIMAGESIHRLFNPVPIVFNQAITVAVLGLLVNGVCIFILGEHHAHHHHHGDDESGHDHHEHDHGHHHHEDHNLRAAYLHVMADALTSFTAIFALLAGKFFGWNWMDPVMGMIGALLVAQWSLGLLKVTGRTLLDHQSASELRQRVVKAVESDGDSRVADLHIWSIGPSINCLSMTVVTSDTHGPDEYRDRLPHGPGIVHSTIEVQRCEDEHAETRQAAPEAIGRA